MLQGALRFGSSRGNAARARERASPGTRRRSHRYGSLGCTKHIAARRCAARLRHASARRARTLPTTDAFTLALRCAAHRALRSQSAATKPASHDLRCCGRWEQRQGAGARRRCVRAPPRSRRCRSCGELTVAPCFRRFVHWHVLELLPGSGEFVLCAQRGACSRLRTRLRNRFALLGSAQRRRHLLRRAGRLLQPGQHRSCPSPARAVRPCLHIQAQTICAR